MKPVDSAQSRRHPKCRVASSARRSSAIATRSICSSTASSSRRSASTSSASGRGSISSSRPTPRSNRWRSIRIETDSDPVTLDRRAYPSGAPILFPAPGAPRASGCSTRGAREAWGPPVSASMAFARSASSSRRSIPLGSREAVRACLHRDQARRGEAPTEPGSLRRTAYQHTSTSTGPSTYDRSLGLEGRRQGRVGHLSRHKLPSERSTGSPTSRSAPCRRAVLAQRERHLRRGLILELSCDGTALDYRGLYPDGSFVAHAKLLRR